jgi:4-aminobutyrate aminotransferase-like enzyme/Ser/Thr protein kinase RdoA (MazF antagonist)
MPDLSLAPAFAPARVAELVAELWGIEGELLALPGERDQNFRVTPPIGQAIVVKITTAEEDRALLDAQHAAFEHLRGRVDICPRLVPTRAGTTLASLPGPNGREHLVRAVAYIPGTPLAELAEIDEPLLEQLGGALGRLDRALLDFDRPALHRDFDWDLARGEAVVRRDSPLIADPELRTHIDTLLARYLAHTQPILPRLRRSTIHADANDHNVIVDPRTRSIVGLIDFGDMVHSWTINELAIAAAYAVLDRPEPLDVIAALCRGYQAEHPLEPVEQAAFYGLLCLRLCVSASLFANQIRQRPGDLYLEISQAPLRRTLPRLLERPFALVREVVHDACTSGLRPRRAASSALLEARQKRVLPSVRLGHRNHPVHLRRAWMQYLFDADGRRLLDAYNNVPHVGHCHPRVVAAAIAQARRLATNTRYVYEALPEYAERLAATLPAPLEVCAFLNSASEANELALRMVRAATGRRDVIVLEHAYHGHTSSLIDISPYKHAGPGGIGAPSWVHVAPMPDLYRGPTGPFAAKAVDEHIAKLDGQLAAFIAETCPSVGGQHLLPSGYLAEVYASVRRAGGLTVADEVQTGFGRLGSCFYAFEEHGVVPDVVVLGKPIGNGFPLAAVVTTRAIADAFDNGMEFFSTYGGNPVACEVGLAVLDVLAEEQLQAHATRVGARLLAGLHELASVHECIGDVRGKGLFLGAELVRDRDARTPDPARASQIVDCMREAGVLIGTDGPDHNVLKIRPPMPFDLQDADRLLEMLARALAVT